MEENNYQDQQQQMEIQQNDYEQQDASSNNHSSNNRMERLQQQIQEAKHSLRHYAQTSPLRQNQQRDDKNMNNNNNSQQKMMRDYATMGEVGRSQMIEENNKSSDVEQVQGGYTEFFSWGNDDKGQLGHGNDQNNAKRTLNLPKSLSFEVLIVAVSCGSQHSGFVTQEGHVFTFGNNVEGQLGIDDRNLTQSTAPLLVASLLNQGIHTKNIACGSYHTIIQTETDQIYTWGRNQQGQCGQSPSISSKIFGPHLLSFEASHPVQHIECGDLTSALITTAGQLYTFGDNSQGQLGLGNGVFRSQVMVDRPTRVQDIHDEVLQISCGYRHALVLTTKGQLYGFGSNRRHEMGLGDSPLAVENNFFAPLKLEALMIHNLVHAAAGGFSAAITDQHQLIVWGTGQFGVFSTPQKVCMEGIFFTDIKVSTQESSFATAIDDKGALFTWGPNFDGQLGHGDFNTRTLPTQVSRLKRKQIRAVAVGDRFSIAIGKDVSLADLRRRKAAKQRKQQELGVEQARAARNSSALRHFNQGGQEHTTESQNEGPPSHRRLNSMHQQVVQSRDDREKSSNLPPLTQQRSYENMHRTANERPHEQRHSSQQARQTYDRHQEPQLVNESQDSPQQQRDPSYENNYSSFQMTRQLNQQNQNEGSHSPLRYKSRGSAEARGVDDQIAVGGQELSAGHSASRKHLELHQNVNPVEHQPLVKSPVTLTINRVTQGPDILSHQRSPCHERVLSNAHTTNLGSTRKDDLERLFNLQLDEKEGVIRQQQATIQELRVQITADQRDQQNKADELNDKVRNLERERNDLRTRLAADLRGYQLSKEELIQKNRRLEDELQAQSLAHQSEQSRLRQESIDREKALIERHQADKSAMIQQVEDQHGIQMNTLGTQKRQEVMMLEDQHRQEVLSLERQRERIESEMHAEIQGLRNLYEKERSQLNDASDTLKHLEEDNRVARDTVASRSQEIRDLQEEKDRVVNHLKAVEIERDAVQERMQVTVSQLNQDISALQKSIGLQNVRLDEAKQREADLLRQLDHEREMIATRDRRLDEQMSEITVHRKQIEDLNYRSTQDEASRSELNQRYEDLRIENCTLQEKLKQSDLHIQSQDNTIQSSRLQLERERQRADTAQNDLDAQTSINAALRRDLSEEQRRVQNRELDIKHLEMALNQLKESMGQEFAAKSRDFENMKRAFDELQREHESVTLTLRQRNDELDSVQAMNRELQAHANTLLDKVTYQESVIVDLEEKNKRLTDLLNNHLYDKAQNYKEKVLDKLSQSRNGAPGDSASGRPVSPFSENHASMRPPVRSITPDHPLRRNPNMNMSMASGAADGDDSSSRLAQLLRREQGEQDSLNRHYMALQQQLNREKLGKSPIRGHEVDFAAGTYGPSPPALGNPGTVSMANIAGPSASPRPALNNPKDSIPMSIFTNQNMANMSTAAEPAILGNTQTDAGPRTNHSPLRVNTQKSPSPLAKAGTLREREQQATAVANLAHYTAGTGLSTATAQIEGNIAVGNRQHISSFNPLTNSGLNIPGRASSSSYSPLRTKTPSKAELEQKAEDEQQLKNASIAASQISHRVMMNELKNLRGQIADVQRQKNELEGRLANYESSQQFK